MTRGLYQREEYCAYQNTHIFTPQITFPEIVVNSNTPKTYYSCHSVQEVELGLKYDCYFSEDQYHLSIQAGWDTQIWSTWAMLDDRVSDLSFMGLNVKARFDF